jgi:hypothetical protein
LLGPISFVMPDDHLNVNYQPAVVHLAWVLKCFVKNNLKWLAVNVLPYEVLCALLDGSYVTACPQLQIQDTLSSVTLDILRRFISLSFYISWGISSCIGMPM